MSEHVSSSNQRSLYTGIYSIVYTICTQIFLIYSDIMCIKEANPHIYEARNCDCLVDKRMLL